jgi:hypothetical protein
MNTAITEILERLINLGQYAQRLFGGAGSLKLNYNWLIVFFFLFVVFLIGLNLGRSRVLLTLLSLYIAAFLEPQFIYFDKLQAVTKFKPDFWLHIGLFLIIYLASIAILNRSLLKQPLTLKETSFFSIALIAILEVGFLASLLIRYLPPEVSGNLPAAIIRLFGTKNARFWWAALPILALLFLKSKKPGQV